MRALIARTIKSNRTALIANILICVLFVWMYVVFFPTMLDQAEELAAAFQGYPQSFLEAFNVEFEHMFSTLEGFLATEHFSFVWPIILIILVLSYGGGAIAGEVDRGTIEVLLAQPLSRLRIYGAKVLSGILILLTFVFVSNLSVIPLAELYNLDYQLANWLTVSVLGFLFGLAIFGVCMLFSSFFSTRGKAASLTGGVIIIMYALNVVSKFKESVEGLKYLSFFHYFDSNAALIHNQIDILNVLVLLAVGVMALIIGAIVFEKRDIAT